MFHPREAGKTNYMSYLFYIDPIGQKPLLHPDCFKLCPEFNILTEEEAFCLILAYDNFSPYRQFAEKERIYRASMQVFNGNNPKLFSSHKWINAVLAYKSLQYNPKLELVKTYQAKIQKMQELIEADDAETKIKTYLSIIKELRNSIFELENEILEGFQKEGQLIGKADLSWLEILMRNKQLFDAKIAKK